MIKLIATDVDGTLLNSRKEISPANLRALQEAADRGIALALGTGRMLSECAGLLAQLPMFRYAITCTGAQTFDLRTGASLARHSFSPEDLQYLCRQLWDLDCFIQVFDDRDGLVHNDARRLADADRYFGPHMGQMFRQCHIPESDFRSYVAHFQGPTNKLHVVFGSPADKAEAKKRLAQVPYTTLESDPRDLEFMPAGVDKGLGLRDLSAHLGLEASELMALGDSANDLAMLQYAGLSVAMGNSTEDVRQQALWITEDLDHDGLARALERLWEKEERVTCF